MSIGTIWRERPLVGRWTLKDVVQGKPIRHPSHALFVHFPSALLPVGFALDLVSRVHGDVTLTRAAFYDIAIGLSIAVLAVITGLVDYLPLVGGSRKRKLGTYHLLGQVWGLGLFAASLALRANDFDAIQTGLVALVLAGLGTLGIFVGNYFGGELVYRQGMRVSTDL